VLRRLGVPNIDNCARNGLTMADNAPEAMLSLVVNTAVPSGLEPSISAHLEKSEFPFVIPA
jgi:hypothetical protein